MVETMLADVAAATGCGSSRCATSTRSGRPAAADRSAGPAPSHALGQLIDRAPRPVGRSSVTGTDYPTRTDPGSATTSTSGTWRRPCPAVERFDRLVRDSAGHGAQPGHRRGDHGARARRRLQPAGRAAVTVAYADPAGPGTAPARSPAATGPATAGLAGRAHVEQGITDTLRWFAVRDQVLFGPDPVGHLQVHPGA